MNDNEGIDYAQFRDAQVRWRRWKASPEGQREIRRIENRAAHLAALRIAIVAAGWVALASGVAVLLTALMAW